MRKTFSQQQWRKFMISIGVAALVVSALAIGLSVYNASLMNDFDDAAYADIHAQVERLEAQEQKWLDQTCPEYLNAGTSVDTWTADKCEAWDSTEASKHQQSADNG